MRVRELWTDVMHVVMHPPQDRVGHRFGGITSHCFIAMQFLDPLEIDDRHDSDQQIDMLRNIDLVGDDGAVQTFVEHHVGVLRNLFPRRKSARLLPEGAGLLYVMQVSAPSALSRLAVGAKQLRQFLKQVRFRAEVAEVVVAVFNLLGHLLLHLRAVVTVKTVALEERGGHALPAKDLLERAHHRRRAGAGRPGDRDDRVLDGHGPSP